MWEFDHKKGWALKNWCFKLWCWRRLLRVPWTARRANQSIPKEINPAYALEGLMLKLQYFGHLMRRADSLEKILMLGKIEGRRRRGRQRMRWLDGIINSMSMNLTKLQETAEERGAWRAAIHGITKSRTRLSDWTNDYLRSQVFNAQWEGLHRAPPWQLWHHTWEAEALLGQTVAQKDTMCTCGQIPLSVQVLSQSFKSSPYQHQSHKRDMWFQRRVKSWQ